jgi:LysM repeat protein
MPDLYTVKRNDSLWSISKTHNVSFQEVKKLNPELASRIPPYGVNPGDKIKLPPPQQKGDVKAVCKTCPKTALTVTVKYTPYPSPVNGATVKLEGPTPKTDTPNKSGIVKFTDLDPGAYEIVVTYDKKHPLVEEALKHVGSTAWAVNADRDPYPSGANKCNLFQYEIANDAGFGVPQRTRFSLRRLSNVWYPPLAGEWADDSKSLGSWSPVSEPEAEPGDSVAMAIPYSDATGHVGIVSYPESGSKKRTLGAGEQAQEEVLLKRRAISAGSSNVVNNDYFWRSGRKGVPYYKRYSQ